MSGTGYPCGFMHMLVGLSYSRLRSYCHSASLCSSPYYGDVSWILE